MKSLLFKITGATGVSVTAGGGTYYLYEKYSPKTNSESILWDGISIAESDEDYKAILEDNKSNIGQAKIPNLTSVTDIETQFSHLKNFCEDLFKKQESKTEKDNIKSWCSLNQIKTVKAVLIKNKIKDFIADKQSEEEENYKTVFSLYKKNSDFVSWLKITDEANVEEKFSDLKNKCSEFLKKTASEITDAEINYVYWWCTIPKFKTIEKKLEADKLIMISETNEWSDRFETWKNTTEIIKAIKASNSEQNSNLSASTDKSEGGQKLKEWCESSKSKKLYEADVYPKTYIQIKSVCVKKQAQ